MYIADRLIQMLDYLECGNLIIKNKGTEPATLETEIIELTVQEVADVSDALDYGTLSDYHKVLHRFCGKKVRIIINK